MKWILIVPALGTLLAALYQPVLFIVFAVGLAVIFGASYLFELVFGPKQPK